MGEPRVFTQSDFHRLANELRLTIVKTEQLCSSFSAHNILDKDFVDAINKKRALCEKFYKLFRTDACTDITYCWNINELFVQLEYPNNPNEWGLFIDKSKNSLIAALVHVADKFPSIPIAYARNMKATYASLQAIIILTQYYEHKWRVCGDLKIVGILMGLDESYSERQCFLCTWEARETEWDSRPNNDYTRDWPTRHKIQIGREIFIPRPLVKLKKRILLSPLQMKLGLLRSFISKLPRDGDAYTFFVKLMEDLGLDAIKVSNGEFKRCHLRDLMRSMFADYLQPLEKEAWEATVDVCQKYLGYYRADNYEELVKRMIDAYKELDVEMSTEIHFLAKHLRSFPEKPGAFDDDKSERYYRDIEFIEFNYEGMEPIKMLGAHAYSIVHEMDDIEQRRKKHRHTFG